MPSYPRDARGPWLLSLGAAPAAQTRVTVRWTLVWTARQRTSCMEMAAGLREWGGQQYALGSQTVCLSPAARMRAALD